MIANSVDKTNFPHKLLLTNTQVLQIFEACVLVNNNLYEKLDSSIEFLIKFDERNLVLLQFHFLLQVLTY